MSVWFMFSHWYYIAHGHAKFEVSGKGEVYLWPNQIGTRIYVEIKIFHNPNQLYWFYIYFSNMNPLQKILIVIDSVM